MLPHAEYLHSVATKLFLDAKRIDMLARSRELSRQRRADLKQRAAKASAMVQTGTDLETAARLMGLKPDQLAMLARLAERDRRAAERSRRDRQVFKLVRLGLTDSEIGARLGLHPKTVNRLYRQERTAR